MKKITDKNYVVAKRMFIILGSLCLILAPLLSFIGWALPHDSWNSLLDLKFSRQTTDATAVLDRTNPKEVFRYYLLPHYFIYTSMVFYAGAGIYLGYLTFRKIPYYALIGSIFVVTGAIYFVGVLGAFLSIPMGTINQTTILKISFGLATFVFFGKLIFGVVLFKYQMLPKFNAVSFIIGTGMIIIFPGIENWMALGSLLMVIGLFPLTKKGLK